LAALPSLIAISLWLPCEADPRSMCTLRDSLITVCYEH